MNKAEIIDKIAGQTQLSKTDVEKIMSCFFEAVKDTLKDKQNVRLVGFGTFSASQRKARTGRNPQTGEEIHIPPCHYPKFKPGKEFKDYLN